MRDPKNDQEDLELTLKTNRVCLWFLGVTLGIALLIKVIGGYPLGTTLQVWGTSVILLWTALGILWVIGCGFLQAKDALKK